LTDKPLVLIVDDTPGNITILMEVLKNEYAIIAARTGAQALKLASCDPKPDIILLDVMMPVMDGYETIERLKGDAATAAIPVLFVTALSDDSDESRGLALGAVDYITKPFNPDIIKLRIANQLELKRTRDGLEDAVRERTKELTETRLEVIRRLGRAAEYRDNETGLHIIRMSKYGQLIALAAGWKEDEAEQILDVSPMHDIGKIGIPDSVLLKPSPLAQEEWEIMRSHCEIGAEIIGGHHSALMKAAEIAARFHHERWDGSGYPSGLKGEEIPAIARIIAIADVFDALTSKRPYKDPWPFDTAVEEIRKQSGTQFDPRFVECFMKVIPEVREIAVRFAG